MRAKATPRPGTGREKKCRTCRASFPAGQIVNGQCPNCSGLVPLPLRGEGGRFLPGLTPARTGRRNRAAVLLLLLVLPLLVLADCEGPDFPDGLLPPGISLTDASPLVALVLVVAAVAWLRRPASRTRVSLAGAR
ncbi:MAG TPA: hypothetical protein VFP72_24500 [Kineosporiaceae bacterium]|nr:hypothetical protein [Kineosporiaceae bacterium]